MADLKIKIHGIVGCKPCDDAFEYYSKFKDKLKGFLDVEVEKIDDTEKIKVWLNEEGEISKEETHFAVPLIEVEGTCGKKEVIGFGDDAKTKFVEATKYVLCIRREKEEESKS